MRNLLAFVAAAVIAFLGLGWYLDWYKIQSVPSVVPGHQSYNFEVDRNKIDKDAKPIVKQGEKAIEKVVEGVIEKKAAEANTPAAAPKPSAAPANSVLPSRVDRPNGIQ